MVIKKSAQIILRTLAGVVLAVTPQIGFARTAPLTQENLLDRIQIEDMMVDYYTLLTQPVRHDISEYFTEDAVLYGNGQRFEGRAAIQTLYDNATDPRVQPSNTYNMVYSNPRITVTGNTAAMDAIWTGYLSDNQYTAPRLVEQGTEHTTFVKQKDVWMIATRTIANVGGMLLFPIAAPGN